MRASPELCVHTAQTLKSASLHIPYIDNLPFPTGIQKVRQKNTNFSAADECVLFNQLSLYQIPKMSGKKGRKLRFCHIFPSYCLGYVLGTGLGHRFTQNLPLCHTCIQEFSMKPQDTKEGVTAVQRLPVTSDIPFTAPQIPASVSTCLLCSSQRVEQNQTITAKAYKI